MSEYHTPVLLTESVSALVTNPSGIYADATFGGGGHTAGVLSRLHEDGFVIAFDRDIQALDNKIDDPRLILIHNNFRFIHNYGVLAWRKGLAALSAGVASGRPSGERAYSLVSANEPEGIPSANRDRRTSSRRSGRLVWIAFSMGVIIFASQGKGLSSTGSWPTWEYRPTSSTQRNGDSRSGSMHRWICA